VTGERGGTAEAGRLLERAIFLLEQVPPGDALAEAYASSGGYYAMAGRPQRTLAAAGKVLALGRPAPKLRSWALVVRGWARDMLGDVGGIEDYREAVRVARSLQMPIAVVFALGNLAESEWLIEGPRGALASYRERWDLAQRHGSMRLGAGFWSESLRPLSDLGEWDELLVRAQQLRPVLEAQGASYSLAQVEPYRAAVLLWQGALTPARAMIEDTLPAARQIVDLQVLVPALAVAALAEQASGNQPAALGWELLAVGVVSGVALVILDRRAGHGSDRGVACYIEKFSSDAITAVLVGVAGLHLPAQGQWWLVLADPRRGGEPAWRRGQRMAVPRQGDQLALLSAC
jgi:hypothetical protein